MSKDLDDVLAAIERLSPQDRAQVLSALKASASLSAVVKTKQTAPDISDDIVLQEIIGFMHQMCVDMSGAKQLAVGARYTTFKAKHEAIFSFFAKSRLNKNETRAMLRVGVSMLYDDCVRMGWAVTSRTLMAHTHRMTAVIDREFPGYARMGFLKLVLKGKKKCLVKTP